MHMADALISPAVAGVMYAASASLAVYSVKKVREENNPKRIPLMGIMGAFVFAAQMLNFTIPGTGSSGHFCGSLLLSVLLGPYAGFLTMIGILAVQCLLFADGGILALGCNIWNMAFYGCFVSGLVFWHPVMRNGVSKRKIFWTSVAGSVISLQLGAFSVVTETMISGITELPFDVFISAMQGIHLVIGVVEGLITASVLIFIYEARPELLTGSLEKNFGRLGFGQTLLALAGITALCAGGLSLAASENPDGLEWSLERVLGTSELSGDGYWYSVAESLQEATAFLPDYAFPGSESMLGTVVSGLFGSLIVGLLCIFCCHFLKLFRDKTA